jgi:hypothetical protein
MRTAIMGIKPKLTPTEARADHRRMLRFKSMGGIGPSTTQWRCEREARRKQDEHQ